MQMVMSGLGILRRFGQSVGPYLMLEILLPGGTLLALLLFLYRRRKVDIGSAVSRAVAAVRRDLASMIGQGIFAPAAMRSPALAGSPSRRPRRVGPGR
jgi:hypothetical protein